ncbi:site-2 protease family protein [Lacinutrix neustonica]|uniref:Zinc metalloprotease n=1 Tax=Lacinutrix neustonica TaxID=2980107 RepID=A0A9E8MWT5_9FLAO|nr:site-2 protease family protein [Lacinutrix neustonica]WAC02786.1 site-2 protease family protein [Lacinutrix neustonica]
MKGNLTIGRVLGIEISIHWTFFFLLLWIALEQIRNEASNEGVVFNLAFVGIVFFCVLLHELGHASVAKRFGIQTKKITLYPIGGVASLERIPEEPKQEFLVAIAGPLVNLVLAMLLYVVIPISSFTSQSFSELLISLNTFTFQNLLLYTFVANLSLFLFNLIPAFPMDGGRVFRALLALFVDRVKATRVAVVVGQFIAVLLLLIGLLYNPVLIFIALFIFISAYGEHKFVKHNALLKDHTVRESMLTDITTFTPNDTIQDVIDVLLTGSETNFVIVNSDHSVAGILYRADVIKHSKNRLKSISEVMTKTHQPISVHSGLKEAYSQLVKEKKPFFAVTEDNKLVGAIDFSNLNEFIILESKLHY